MIPRAVRRRIEWIIVAGTVIVYAWFSLRHLQHEQLFLISLPWDRVPLASEVRDAANAAQTWMWPTLIFLAVALTAIASSEPAGPVATTCKLWQRLRELLRLHPRLCLIFAAACVADFVSTLIYFHSHRIDDELHPGMKLFTYAYGLSIGCLVGKAVQAMLALIICAIFPTHARAILITLIVAYVAAAVWNLALG